MGCGEEALACVLAAAVAAPVGREVVGTENAGRARTAGCRKRGEGARLASALAKDRKKGWLLIFLVAGYSTTHTFWTVGTMGTLARFGSDNGQPRRGDERNRAEQVQRLWVVFCHWPASVLMAAG